MLGFGRKKPAKADAVPRTLSEDLLGALTGACPLPAAGENERRAFGRVVIGTRATLRAARDDSEPVPVLLRDLCAASVGILIDSPVAANEEYWIYIPKPDDPDDVVSLSCVMVRCDPGGFERSAYVAAATFIEGEPPPLPEAVDPAEAAGSPNQLEEEGQRAPVIRVGGLFLPPDPAAAAPAPPTADPAALDPAALDPAATDQHVSAALEPAQVPAPAQPAPMQAPAEVVTPEPAICPPPVCRESSLEAARAAEAPVEHWAPAMELTPAQIRRMADTIRPHLAYLKRMMNRLDHYQIGPDDSLRQGLDKAHRAVEQLQMLMESQAAPASQAPDPTPDKRAAKHSSKGYQPKGYQPKGYPPKPDEIQCLIQLRQALLPSIN
jgi:hypothetical protein